MGSICYAWNNAIFNWNNARLTWKDFCVIQTLLYERVPYHRKRRRRREYEEELIEKQRQDSENFEESDTEIIQEEFVEKEEIIPLTKEEKEVILKIVLQNDSENKKILKEVSKKINSNIIIDIDNIEMTISKNDQINIKINFDGL